MAFTATELVILGDIVGMNPVELDDWLDTVTVSAEVEDAIQADIVIWSSTYANSAGIQVEPKESNFGARINGDLGRDDIITRTRRRLQIPNASGMTASMGSLAIG
jgi:hypothetical protein